MRITDQMVTAFDDGSDVMGISRTPDVYVVPADIWAGLHAVAPLIAEAAMTGYIEQGARLQQAERLLARARAVIGHGSPTSADIDSFLGPNPGDQLDAERRCGTDGRCEHLYNHYHNTTDGLIHCGDCDAVVANQERKTE